MDELELQIKIDTVIADLCDWYDTDEISFTENEELLSHITRYAQDIITHDELIDWCEELYETPNLLELDEDSF